MGPHLILCEDFERLFCTCLEGFSSPRKSQTAQSENRPTWALVNSFLGRSRKFWHARLKLGSQVFGAFQLPRLAASGLVDFSNLARTGQARRWLFAGTVSCTLFVDFSFLLLFRFVPFPRAVRASPAPVWRLATASHGTSPGSTCFGAARLCACHRSSTDMESGAHETLKG